MWRTQVLLNSKFEIPRISATEISSSLDDVQKSKLETVVNKTKTVVHENRNLKRQLANEVEISNDLELQIQHYETKTKRRRSDPVLWHKPLHQQKCPRDKVTTQTTPQKSSIKQHLRTDLGRSVGVTTVTQLVRLTGLRAHLPTPRNSRVIKRTHI